MITAQKIIITLLLLTAIFTFSSCGKKTPLFFNDRAGSYGIDVNNDGFQISNLKYQIEE